MPFVAKGSVGEVNDLVDCKSELGNMSVVDGIDDVKVDNVSVVV